MLFQPRYRFQLVDANADTKANPITNTSSNADTDADTRASPNADTNAQANANTHADADTKANAITNPDPHADADPNANADPHTDTNAPLRGPYLESEHLDGCTGLQGISERDKRGSLHIYLRDDNRVAVHGFFGPLKSHVLLCGHRH